MIEIERQQTQRRLNPVYNITKGELIFILDTVEEIADQLSSAHIDGEEELKEVVTIINGILDKGDWRTNND